MMDTSGWQYDDPNNTKAPDFMGTGAYAKWKQGSDPDYDPADPAVKQSWWRSPQVGGGIVYHPYWGWQDRSAVKNLYKSDADNNVTWDEFSNWGLTKQTGNDWRQYFPNAQTDAELGAGGGEQVGAGWTGDLNLGGSGGTGGTAGTGGTMPNTVNGYDASGLGAFTNYPSQWGQQQGILDYLGSNTPWQSQEASGIASGLAQGVDPWYQAAQQKGWYDTQDSINTAAERAGLGGTRWSTPLGRTAQDIAGRQASSLASEYAQQMQNARLQGAGLLQGLGNDANNQLFGVSDRLGQLGSNMFNAPQEVAKNSYAMGQSNQATTQSALDKYFQEFMRTSDEQNPYLSMIYSMATGQGTPQQYTSGAGSQILSMLGGIGKLFTGK
jgi:hypothetical protein